MLLSMDCQQLKRIFGIAAILCMGLATLAHAQNKKVREKNCGDYDTQSEMNDCAAREAKKADTALNKTYQQLLSKISDNKTATARVVAAEKAWIAFRDAELAAEWPVAQGDDPNVLYGSAHPLCYYGELAAMKLQRVETLKELMRYEEGDVCSSGVALSKPS